MPKNNNEPQVTAAHYNFEQYVTFTRFCSFWQQIMEVLSLSPRSVVEIGPGSGLVTQQLRGNGVFVTTMDFAPDLKPDILGSVTAIPLPNASSNVVLCAQVLEHLPFDKFGVALGEISRIATTGAIITLPHHGRTFRYLLRVPWFGEIKFLLDLNWRPREHLFDGQHYWEIGKRGYSISRVLREIEAHFHVERHYRFWHNPYHHFFIVRSINIK
jgi:hypothetical protein